MKTFLLAVSAIFFAAGFILMLTTEDRAHALLASKVQALRKKVHPEYVAAPPEQMGQILIVLPDGSAHWACADGDPTLDIWYKSSDGLWRTIKGCLGATVTRNPDPDPPR